MSALVKTTFICLLMWPALSIAGKPPFLFSEAIVLDQEYPATTAAFAAKSLPYALLQNGGGTYWLFNLETLQARIIASNREAGLTDGRVRAGWWSQDKAVFFYPHREVIYRVDPNKPDQPEIIAAEIRAAPLRMAKWLDEPRVLIDEVYTYAMEDGQLTEREQTSRRHLPMQTGLVVLADSRYVTSGYEDQSIQVWSLPDGERLQEWTLGRWFSSRRVSHIAVTQGRLLVASSGGRIEERSLETGEVLWSIRPCRGGAAVFHHSSQYRHIGSAFRQVLTSINTDDRLYYACGTRLGAIQWAEGEWQHVELTQTLALTSPIVNVEAIPHTSLAVLTLAEGEVMVFNRDSGVIVQTLQSILQDNPNGVTYVAATQQLLVMGQDHKIYLYDLAEGLIN